MQDGVDAVQKLSKPGRLGGRHRRDVLGEDRVQTTQVPAQLGFLNREGEIGNPPVLCQRTRNLPEKRPHGAGLLFEQRVQELHRVLFALVSVT